VNKELIERYFKDNKLNVIPSKHLKKYEVFKYISNEYLKEDVIYDEIEINNILKNIYSDYALLRRYLVDYKLIDRSRDCKTYWKKK
jgi:hypothetical protein